MARNKVVYLRDIELKTVGIRSKYYVNKHDYVNKQYNDLYLKDIVVCSNNSEVLGVCDCACGNIDIVTGIFKLISNKTKCCNECLRSVGSGKIRTKYADSKFIGCVIGYLEILDYYSGKLGNHSGIIWKTQCLRCGSKKDFLAGQLANNTTVSCGCLAYERNHLYSSEDYNGTVVGVVKIKKVLPKSTLSTGEQCWLCECKYCGKEFTALARHVVYKHTVSCGCLHESIGEYEISDYLSRSFIKFKREFTFDDLVSQNGGKLRYDFCILGDNASPIALIEYDGNHHFSEDFQYGFDKEASFKFVQDSDNRKTNYAKQSNIPLLRIPYNRDIDIVLNQLTNFLVDLNILKERSSNND